MEGHTMRSKSVGGFSVAQYQMRNHRRRLIMFEEQAKLKTTLFHQTIKVDRTDAIEYSPKITLG